MLCTLIGAIILSINIQVGFNMHLNDDIGDASSSLRGSTLAFFHSLQNVFISTFWPATNFFLNAAIQTVKYFTTCACKHYCKMCSVAIMFAPEHLKRVRKVCTIISESKRFLNYLLLAKKCLGTSTFCKILNCLLFMFLYTSCAHKRSVLK